MNKEYNGASLVAKTLKDLGIRRVYLFPGGTMQLLSDATEIAIQASLK